MERMPFAIQSYIYLIQFCYEHNETIIEKWIKPHIWQPVQYLILSHDSIDQLNVMPNIHNRFYNGRNNNGITSLWDIIDHTVTPMGRRLLRMNISHPIINKDELQNRYDTVDKLINSKEYINIKTHIDTISDLDRLHRRIQINLLHPSQIIQLEASHTNCIKTYDYVKEKLPELIFSGDIEIFKKSVDEYKNLFYFDKLIGVQNNQITENIFNKGLYPDIDELQSKMDYCDGFMTAFAIKLSSLINNANIDIKSTDKEGHYLSLSHTKANLLKEELKKYTTIDVTVNDKTSSVNVRDIELKSLSSTTKITIELVSKLSNDKIVYQSKINRLCMEELRNLYNKWSNNFFELWNAMSNWIAKLDFLSCIAKVSFINKYCKPQLSTDHNNSFIDCNDLRHPIIEKLPNLTHYIPNNVKLGTNDQMGILLYGLNAVGKSSLMKSIGLSVIMAQAGFYVPASSYKFQPYQQLFTRISNHDNLFKGQSTFAVEMSELRSIIKRTNKNSIVLGDELCSGTETTSGVAIVATTIITLYEKLSSFLFATHLHDLSKLDDILAFPSVRHYHMETVYEPNTKRIVYNRKLKEGSGSAIYGLEVAKAMDLDMSFIDKANEIRRKILGKSTNIVDNSVSSYNANVIKSVCSICKKPTDDIHHINEQHMADVDGYIGHTHKNNLSNLVQLCKDCHNNVHHGNLRINGYQMTSDGVQLNYEYVKSEVEEKKENDISDDSSGDELIKSIYQRCKSIAETQRVLKSLHNINITIYKIKKLLNK
jgi:DNA mismatch repair protein MutS